MVSGLRLLLREAARGFLISLRASNRYAPRYLESLEFSLALLADYAEAHNWPSIPDVTTAHLEQYLVHLQQRPRWFGERDRAAQRPPSQSHIETQYRRIKRFYNWLVERGHIERNPLDLIPHPHIDERVVPTVAERDAVNLLRLTDPQRACTAAERFRAVRNRAVLYVLVDTPVRREELASLQVADVDVDGGRIKVMGKGRRERWMPLGAAAQEALWEYQQARRQVARAGASLWVNQDGSPFRAQGIYRMLKRLGERAGVPGLHTHRFRHTYVIAALRGGMPERVLEWIGGWKRIPQTYVRTIGYDEAVAFHRRLSPGDRLGQEAACRGRTPSRGGKPRGRL